MSQSLDGQQHHPRTVFRGNWAALSNPNVRRVLIFCFIDGACYSLWYTQVLQVFISRLFGDTTVGWLSATTGVAQMLGAVIVGFSGNQSREIIIRLGVLCGIVATGLTMCALYILQVYLFFFSSFLWGMYSGMVTTGTETLFADSIENGRRDFAYNLKWINQILSGCVGSVTSLVMLLCLGNEWDLVSLKTLMYIGVSLHPIAHLVLFTLKDKHTLDENASEQTPQIPPAPVVVVNTLDNDDQVNNKTPMPSLLSQQDDTGMDDDLAAASQSLLGDAGMMRNAGTDYQDAVLVRLAMKSAQRREEYLANQESRNPVTKALASLCHYTGKMYEWSAVPYLVCLFDFIMAFGSGMTMRYIPLFFVNDYFATPVLLMSTSIVISLVTAVTSSIVRYLGERYVDRIVAVFVVRMIGTTLLLLMGLTHLNIFILIPIFIIRNSMMNSTMGVTRSVIMDCVPRSSRAKWSAWESFSSLTWAGSAVIGGYIAEAKGYQATFVITAVFHYIGISILIPVVYGSRDMERAKRKRWWREEIEKRERRRNAQCHSDSNDSSNSNSNGNSGDTCTSFLAVEKEREY